MNLFKKITIAVVVLIAVLIVCSKQLYWTQSDKIEANSGKQSHASSESIDPKLQRPTERVNRGKRSKKVMSELKTFCADMAAIQEVDWKNYDEDERRAYGEMSKALDKITEPQTLELLFWNRAFDRGTYMNGRRVKLTVENDIKIKEIKLPPGTGRESIMFRLSELKTDEAARIAVKLKFHWDNQFDAGSSESASQAVIDLGPLAIPHLEKLKSRLDGNSKRYSKRDVEELIEYIQQGKNYF